MDRNRGLSNLSHLLTKHGDRQLFKNAQIIFEEKKKKRQQSAWKATVLRTKQVIQ